ncbi:hypothetical protein SAMN02745751_01916 [Dethiosulfatibacter aminovorans DSM 17477]|uniref:Uncharacterized protein n=1 Tax=Dethiosulfatibacter aminovorans DSM 17477 TaxID=1121476 RepID=A0A1M6H517_9FIRM|nr:hypothetical protein SAMN02745751_01916 [Dethiosulfatibacter aminovorans DSM 17477]
MRNYLKEGYETYKRIEYYRTEKRRNESRNNIRDILGNVF